MHRIALLLILAAALQAASPFVGRWDFNLTTPRGNRAMWLGITEQNGSLEIWYQPGGGNVYRVSDFQMKDKQLQLTLGKATDKGPRPLLELDAAGDKLTGVMRTGERSQPLEGVRAPKLDRKAPKSWNKPESLFNGTDLTGWEPMGNPSDNHWVVKDGQLLNQDRGANLKTTRTFDDFKLHFEVNYPDHANSGFYLRGRYEIQLESEPLTSNPPERRIGSVYGRITPKGDLPRNTDVWDTFDITLVGRKLTVVRNGVTTIDAQEIEGITGGALDANEGEPGPFYVQGDHTGGLKFRNITVSTAKR